MNYNLNKYGVKHLGSTINCDDFVETEIKAQRIAGKMRYNFL